MIHLFQHSNGKLKNKYDISLVVKGKVIFSTVQGYNKEKDAINAMRVVGNLYLKYPSWHYQDDTQDKPVVMYAVQNAPLKNIITSPTNLKVTKKYIPNKQK